MNQLYLISELTKVVGYATIFIIVLHYAIKDADQRVATGYLIVC